MNLSRVSRVRKESKAVKINLKKEKKSRVSRVRKESKASKEQPHKKEKNI